MLLRSMNLVTCVITEKIIMPNMHSYHYWKDDSLNNDGYASGVLIDLSEAFDTLKHKVLIAKLDAYAYGCIEL